MIFRSLRRASRLALVVAALAGAPLLAARPVQAQAVNTDRAGVALNGYDPVAYFTEGRAVAGAPGITADHAGVRYRFATEAHRATFLADPARYLPAYGGYCAYGVAQGHKVTVDPEAFRVVDGRLYLNYSKGVQKKWLEDVPGNIRKADGNWETLRDRPRD